MLQKADRPARRLTARLTDSRMRALPPPAAGYALHWCPDTPGFGVRVSANGSKAWIAERRVNGKTTRRTLGRAAGRGAISCDVARGLAREVWGELERGIDRAAERRAAREASKVQAEVDALTLAVAVREYVAGKRRGKDGLPLKARTQADYVAMIEPGRVSKDGKPFADGLLYSLADVPLRAIAADQLRDLHGDIATRSQRQADYAAQVFRAVANWHGVRIEGSPFDKATPGRDRIVLKPSKGNPSPIPPERLGAWWRAATGRAGSPSADGLRVALLTGARPGEVFGSTHAPGLLVRDVDLAGGRMTLVETKNRADHAVLLSRQALAILKAHIEPRMVDAKARGPKAVAALQASRVFDVSDPGKMLDAINAEAGTRGVSAHRLRHSFASTAEDLVTAGALKAMLNHSAGADVTQAHYLGRSEAKLRAAWQAVADAITGAGPLE